MGSKVWEIRGQNCKKGVLNQVFQMGFLQYECLGLVAWDEGLRVGSVRVLDFVLAFGFESRVSQLFHSTSL